MALWLKANGTTQEVTPGNGSDFTLEELHRFVGGYIEIVRAWGMTEPDRILVLHEEGKLVGLPFNRLATLAYGVQDDWIAGDALLATNEEVK